MQKKSNEKSKKNTNCPHLERKHYDKNMCNNCYHAFGRDKKAWICAHNDKSHYALGLCQSCYHSKYAQGRKFENNKIEDKQESEIKNENENINLSSNLEQ